MKGVDKMENLSFRPNDIDAEITVKTYSNMLFKLCFTILRNNEDAKDAVSEVFLKYLLQNKAFENEEHKKAWLIRVATNISKNMLKASKIRSHISFEEVSDYCKSDEEKETFFEMLKLPEKYRIVLHLYYAEGYKTAEIGKMLHISSGAVRKRLQYGREKLKIEYEKGDQL